MANAISGWKQISQSVLENLQSICISGFQRKSMMLTFGGFEDGCCKEENHIRNSYLFLSGGYCVEDVYLSAKTIKKKSHRYKSCGILCLCEFIIVLGQCIGGNAMEFELLADSIKQINDKASSAAKSAVNQLMT